MKSTTTRAFALALVACLYAGGAAATIISADLIGDPDLPTAILYPSGPGDLLPASISSSTDAAAGLVSLEVHSGTVINGGSTLGGFAKGIPSGSMAVGSRYSVVYDAKSDTGGPVSFHLSFQSGGGDENSLSHSVTLGSTWMEYTYTATLTGVGSDIPKPTLYAYGLAPDVTWLVDDFRIFEVTGDTPGGLSTSPVPLPGTLVLLGIGLAGLMLRGSSRR